MTCCSKHMSAHSCLTICHKVSGKCRALSSLSAYSYLKNTNSLGSLLKNPTIIRPACYYPRIVHLHRCKSKCAYTGGMLQHVTVVFNCRGREDCWPSIMQTLFPVVGLMVRLLALLRQIWLTVKNKSISVEKRREEKRHALKPSSIFLLKKIFLLSILVTDRGE